MKVAVIGATCMNKSISTIINLEELKDRGILIIASDFRTAREQEILKNEHIAIKSIDTYNPIKIEQHQHFYRNFDYKKKGKHKK